MPLSAPVRDVDQQLVPHRADDVVADGRGQAGAIELGGDGQRALADRAVELADDGVLAGGARDDAARAPAARRRHRSCRPARARGRRRRPGCPRGRGRSAATSPRCASPISGAAPSIASRVWKDLTSTITRSTGPTSAHVVAALTATRRSPCGVTSARPSAFIASTWALERLTSQTSEPASLEGAADRAAEGAGAEYADLHGVPRGAARVASDVGETRHGTCCPCNAGNRYIAISQ